MTVRKRTWVTRSGQQRQAWVVAYVERGQRRLKTCTSKQQADAFAARLTLQHATDPTIQRQKARDFQPTIQQQLKKLWRLTNKHGDDVICGVVLDRLKVCTTWLDRVYGQGSAKRTLASIGRRLPNQPASSERRQRRNGRWQPFHDRYLPRRIGR